MEAVETTTQTNEVAMKPNRVLVIHSNADFMRAVLDGFDGAYEVIEKSSLRTLMPVSRIYNLACVILYIDRDTVPDAQYFKYFKKRFPAIPCLAAIHPNNLKLARQCGTLGIDSVLSYHDPEGVAKEVDALCEMKSFKVSLSELGIKKDERAYSKLMREALGILEQDYLKIVNTAEIAELMNVSECTVSREFAKWRLPGPKKVLMGLKIRHAIKLMSNMGFNVREIALFSGFSDEKRMSECFHRTFGMPPGKYRTQYILAGKPLNLRKGGKRLKG